MAIERTKSKKKSVTAQGKPAAAGSHDVVCYLPRPEGKPTRHVISTHDNRTAALMAQAMFIAEPHERLAVERTR